MKETILKTLLIIIFCTLVAFYICLWVKYADKPLGEIPMCVAWILFKD